MVRTKNYGDALQTPGSELSGNILKKKLIHDIPNIIILKYYTDEKIIKILLCQVSLYCKSTLPNFNNFILYI